MSDDLLKRLERREESQAWYDGGYRNLVLVNPDGPEAATEIRRLNAELEGYRKAARRAWFWHADGEGSYDTIDDLVDYLDLEQDDVIEVRTASELPTIWCAVRIAPDEDADEQFTFTEHATEAEARAALGRISEGEGR